MALSSSTPTPRIVAAAAAGLLLLGTLGACSLLPGDGTPEGARFVINTPDFDVEATAVAVVVPVEVENVGIFPGGINVTSGGDVSGVTVANCKGGLAAGATCNLQVTIPADADPATTESATGEITLTVSNGNPLFSSSITITVVDDV